jgi:hypothetical protein
VAIATIRMDFFMCLSSSVLLVPLR